MRMSETGRRAAWGTPAVLFAACVSAGCLVQVDHCENADAAFREARAEAAGLAGRGGGASQVNVLVFDPDDEKLVRIRVPMWLALFGYWVPGFGCSIALGFFTPLEGTGIWIGFATGLLVVAVLLTWRWSARARLGLLPV